MQDHDQVADIQKRVVLNAPIQKVWEAVSSAEGLSAWFMPNDFKAEEGHEFTIQSPFGPSPCKVLEVNPPNKLSFLWDVSGWVVSFELKELEAKTELTLVHSGWKKSDEIIPKAEEKSSIIRDRMDQGWEMLVNVSLRKAVEG